MKRLSVLLSVLVIAAILSVGQLSIAQNSRPFVEVNRLRTEYQVNPVGIDVLQPRFSWQIKANVRDISQIAYEVRVALTFDKVKNGDPLFWTSKKVTSDESNQVVYEGPALKPGKRYYWTVRVWDNQNHITDWSPISIWKWGC
jgi:alpha-L-rhamnosidase